jgi:1-acyl-sn-glycerol-3-phosphate acyltransferase
MLTLFLLCINLILTVLGAYIFDFLPDGQLDQPLVVILSFFGATIIMLLVLYFYIELMYILVAAKKPENSMVKHKLAKQMTSIPLYLTNTKITVIGKENLPKDPGFAIYSNHTSLMDIPLFMHAFHDYPVAFLAKEVVKNIFSIGKWVESLGGVMIDRSNPRKGAEAIIKVIKNVKSGSTMVIFPEGTRSKVAGQLLPFKDGSFKVALKSKAPLVPVTIVKNWSKTMFPLPRRITIVVHKAIQYEEIKGMKSQELSDKVEKIIKSAL